MSQFGVPGTGGFGPLSSAAGWYARSTPLPSANFYPTLNMLLFSVFASTPVNPDGFSVAFFRPNIAVDAAGMNQ